jgi:hypothetical protein
VSHRHPLPGRHGALPGLLSVHRAAVRVAGERSICHWSDLSEGRLRSVSKLVVILPDHNTITVYTRLKENRVTAYVQQYAGYQGGGG